MSFLITLIGYVAAAIVCLIISLIIYARWNYGKLEKLGIPVVKPFLFLGSNYMEPYINNFELDIERHKKYGDIYGVYAGRAPQIYISDPKLVRLILTVDSDHFPNHGWVTGTNEDGVLENVLDLLKDEQWKVVRQALTPTFTSGKLRQLSIINQEIAMDYTQTLLKQCEANNGRVNKIQFKNFLAPMVIEILSKCFCGITIPNAKDENNSFIRDMKAVLHHDAFIATWKNTAAQIFPILNYLVPSPLNPDEGLDFFLKVFVDILTERERTGETSIDATNTFVEILKKSRDDPTYKRLKITKNVILAQAFEYFLAGFLGIRDNIELVLYQCAVNEEIQDRLYKEIRNVSKGEDITLEHVGKMPYLAACINEVLRTELNFVRHERLCSKNWTNGDLKIPKGTQVIFNVAAIHHNPKFYPEPFKYNPERFMPGNKESLDAYAFLPFGHGPRNCIGQRFALDTIKLCLATLLMKIQVKKRNDTKAEYCIGGGFALSHKPIYLDVIKR